MAARTERERPIHWRYSVLLAVLVFTAALSGLLAGRAFAGTTGSVAPTIPDNKNGQIAQDPLGGPTPTPDPCSGAYHYFVPEAGAPPNGGTVNVGDRFILDMMVHTG